MSSRERKTITRSVSSYNIKPINIRILSYNNQLKTHTKDQNFPIEEHYWKPNSLSAKTRLMFIMKFLWNQTASLVGGFVKKSACSYSESTCEMSNSLFSTCSRRTWVRTSMCFELEFVTGLNPTWIAPSLSSKSAWTDSQIRRKKMPHVPLEKRLPKFFYHCNVLGLTRAECGAFFRPWNPLDCRIPAHHGCTRDRLPFLIVGGISGVGVNYQL